MQDTLAVKGMPKTITNWNQQWSKRGLAGCQSSCQKNVEEHSPIILLIKGLDWVLRVKSFLHVHGPWARGRNFHSPKTVVFDDVLITPFNLEALSWNNKPIDVLAWQQNSNPKNPSNYKAAFIFRALDIRKFLSSYSMCLQTDLWRTKCVDQNTFILNKT